MNPDLTQPYEPTLRRQILKTVDGMAHWADSSEQGGGMPRVHSLDQSRVLVQIKQAGTGPKARLLSRV